MNREKHRYTPFISSSLNKAEAVFIREGSKAGGPLAPLYRSPYKVIERHEKEGYFIVEGPHGPDKVAMARLKAATTI